MFYTTLFNSPLLRAGDHALIVTVENSGYNPPWWGQTGFDLKARFVPVPEPATWFAGIAALAMFVTGRFKTSHLGSNKNQPT
jgi:hypothetical protein